MNSYRGSPSDLPTTDLSPTSFFFFLRLSESPGDSDFEVELSSSIARRRFSADDFGLVAGLSTPAGRMKACEPDFAPERGLELPLAELTDSREPSRMACRASLVCDLATESPSSSTELVGITKVREVRKSSPTVCGVSLDSIFTTDTLAGASARRLLSTLSGRSFVPPIPDTETGRMPVGNSVVALSASSVFFGGSS